ncbi:MAG: carbohydrate ABC transporter permease [Fimbriimonadales bacterium]
MRREGGLSHWLGRALLLAYGIVIVLPLAWVLVSSVKKGADILASPWTLPASPQWQNYVNAWADPQRPLGPAFVNSMVVSVFTLLFLLPIGAMAAYVFAKYPFRGSKLLFGLFLGGMMFPQFLTIVPLFKLMQSMHLLNTMSGLVIVYIAYSLSFTVFVLHGFFEALPNELMEAAAIDGCTDHATFWKVMLPLAKPGLIVVAIFNAIGFWNEYSLALVLYSHGGQTTLPVRIADMATARQYQSDWGALFAGIVIVVVPILVVYWLFKDRIQQAMTAGAVKG